MPGHSVRREMPTALHDYSPRQAAGADPLAEPCRDGDCPFCAEALADSNSPFDQVLASGPGVNLLPALGMLTPGYFLVTAEQHVLSMADLQPGALMALDQWLRGLMPSLTAEFGRYLVFEHGSCVSGGAGACVDHAHLHLIPLAARLIPDLLVAARWHSLDEYTDVHAHAGTSYAYLGWDGAHRVLVDPKFGSQWIRRQVAAALGTDAWDWALFDGRGALDVTLARLARVEFPQLAAY